jgi:hypothetical protein
MDRINRNVFMWLDYIGNTNVRKSLELYYLLKVNFFTFGLFGFFYPLLLYNIETVCRWIGFVSYTETYPNICISIACVILYFVNKDFLIFGVAMYNISNLNTIYHIMNFKQLLVCIITIYMGVYPVFIPLSYIGMIILFGIEMVKLDIYTFLLAYFCVYFSTIDFNL